MERVRRGLQPDATTPPTVIAAAGSTLFIGAIGTSGGGILSLELGGASAGAALPVISPLSEVYAARRSPVISFEPPEGTGAFVLGSRPHGGLDAASLPSRHTNLHSVGLAAATPAFTASTQFLQLTLTVSDLQLALAANLSVLVSRGVVPLCDPSLAVAWAASAACDVITLVLSAPSTPAANGSIGGAPVYAPVDTGSAAAVPPSSDDNDDNDGGVPLAYYATWELPYPQASGGGGGGAPWLFAVSASSSALASTPLFYSPSAALQPCSARCGGYCAQDTQGALTFYWCACPQPQKWAGALCDVSTQSAGQYALELGALVGSNAVAAAAAILALRAGLWMEALVFASSGISSGVYHTCDTGDWCAAVGFGPLQAFDFATAYLSIFVISVRLAGVPDAVRNPLVVGVAALLLFLMFEPMNNLGITLEVAAPITLVAVLGGMCYTICGACAAWSTAHGGGRAGCAAVRAALTRRGAVLWARRGRGWCVRGGVSGSGTVRGKDEREGALPLMREEEREEWEEMLPQSSGVVDDGHNNELSPAGSNGRFVDGQGSDDAACCTSSTLLALPTAVAVCVIDVFVTPGNFRLTWLAAGIGCFISALACKVSATNDTYWVFHSLWHVFSYGAAASLVCARADYSVPLRVAALDVNALQAHGKSKRDGAGTALLTNNQDT